jgi:Predicted acyltransferases
MLAGQAEATGRAGRFQRIQILRALAAGAVLLYHTLHYVGEATGLGPVGRPWFVLAWGVQLFFVISGFVLSHVLLRSRPNQFLIHRVLRIYPIYWMTVVLVAFVPLLGGAAQSDQWLDPGVLLLLPIGPAIYPIGVEWTLIYEVFFYALLFLLAWFGAPWITEGIMLVWIFAIWGADRILPSVWTSFTPELSQILFSGFNLPFIAGVLTYGVYRRGGRMPVGIATMLGLLCLVLAYTTPKTEYQLAWQALGFACWVLAAVSAKPVQPSNLPQQVLVRLGDASYGLYLMHVPVITGAIVILGPWLPNPAVLAFVALSLALALGGLWGTFDVWLYRRLKSRVDDSWFKALKPRH